MIKTLNALSICVAAALVAACGGGDGDPRSSQETSVQFATESRSRRKQRLQAPSSRPESAVREGSRAVPVDEGLRRRLAATASAPVCAHDWLGGPSGLASRRVAQQPVHHGWPTPAPFGPPTFGPFNSILWNDVWESRDLGASWTKLPTPKGPNMWSERAYFQAVTKGGAMFVLGGQDFTVRPNLPPVCPPPPAPGAPPPMSGVRAQLDVLQRRLAFDRWRGLAAARV